MGVLNDIATAVTRRAQLLTRRPMAPVTRSNRVARVLVDAFDTILGRGAEWADPQYGKYYATSATVHAAVRVRAEAVSRPELIVLERPEDPASRASTLRSFDKAQDGQAQDTARPARGSGGGWVRAAPDHPLAALLERPNPFWTATEMWRATETYLLLWGSAFWGIEKDETGRISELWPLRPDRMRVLPDERRYIRGFVYEHNGPRIAYLPDEVVWFRHFNPLDEFAGLSSVAPARVGIDMATEAATFNRNFFSNSATPGDLAITSEQTPTEEEVAEFYDRWESRFRGSKRSHRPILLSSGMDIKRVGLSQRDMEFIAGLRWSVEEVSRVFGVPKAFLADLKEATFANINAEERFFWRNTLVPELRMLQAEVNRSLTPHFAPGGGLRVEFDLGSIEALQDAEGERVDRLVKLLGAGVLTVDEVRERENLPPLG